MNRESLLKMQGSFVPDTGIKESFQEMDATELYCPKCKQAVPVHKRLLLVLPEGEKYEYRCVFCAESVGTKINQYKKSVYLDF